ncbi:MAG TPA: hypothetical protein VGK67_33990 [Myxococcales bacterium]
MIPSLAAAPLLACLALAACGGNGPSTSGAKLVVSEESYDFGQVPLGELREHTFTIKNAGTGVLELHKEATVKAVEGC